LYSLVLRWDELQKGPLSPEITADLEAITERMWALRLLVRPASFDKLINVGLTQPTEQRDAGRAEAERKTEAAHTTVLASAPRRVETYDEFKTALCFRSQAERAEANVERAYQAYTSGAYASSNEYFTALQLERRRRVRNVSLDPPTVAPATFADLLIHLAQFALANRLERLDLQFRDHPLLQVNDDSYDFNPAQLKVINRLYDDVDKTGGGRELYVPKRMRDGYVFVDSIDSEVGGMIRWYEVGGGNPKYSFWLNEDGLVEVSMA
jgi:hypothetical protein